MFTKLDLKDAYHRIRIKKGDEWKTAFRTRYGHYKYNILPFRLANISAMFQAYINRALEGLFDDFCVVYLDNILIYSESLEEHSRHVRKILARLRQFDLFVNLKKCEFRTKSVEFLGFIVSTEGVAMDRRRVEAIDTWKEPGTYREIQVFLGFANFYRRFIHQYSKKAAPMTDLLKGMKNGRKSGKFEWPEQAARAFRELREVFTKGPLFRHFDPNQPIRVETDASGFAVAGILTQPDSEGQWRPVAFWSRKMSKEEQHYDTHDQELLAIVAAFREWRHYLEGARFPIVVLTDHNNLRYFMTTKVLSGRQARWALRLAPFDFVLSYRAGTKNPADGPSRRPDYRDKEDGDEDIALPTLQRKLRDLKALNTRAASEVKPMQPVKEAKGLTMAVLALRIEGLERERRLTGYIIQGQQALATVPRDQGIRDPRTRKLGLVGTDNNTVPIRTGLAHDEGQSDRRDKI